MTPAGGLYDTQRDSRSRVQGFRGQFDGLGNALGWHHDAGDDHPFVRPIWIAMSDSRQNKPDAGSKLFDAGKLGRKGVLDRNCFDKWKSVALVDHGVASRPHHNERRILVLARQKVATADNYACLKFSSNDLAVTSYGSAVVMTALATSAHRISTNAAVAAHSSGRIQDSAHPITHHTAAQSRQKPIQRATRRPVWSSLNTSSPLSAAPCTPNDSATWRLSVSLGRPFIRACGRLGNWLVRGQCKKPARQFSWSRHVRILPDAADLRAAVCTHAPSKRSRAPFHRSDLTCGA